MQEHIRALIVIVFLAAIGFYAAKKVVQQDVPSNSFNRWRNIWFLITFSAFFANNFWVFLILTAFFIIFLTNNEKNKIALYLILLFIVPPLTGVVSGMGMVNYLFNMSYPRLIALVVLLPAALAIAQKNDFRFSKIWTDKLVMLYMLLLIVLEYRDTTITDTLRKAFYIFTDVFLPYYVMSRGVKDLSQMRTALCAFVTSAIVVAIIAVFESLKHWILYHTLSNVLGVNTSMGSYIGRSGELRAIASLSHPIVLGYFMTVAFGMYCYLSTSIKNVNIKRLGFVIIILGLLAPLSRGPWVGAAALLVVFILQGTMAFKRLGVLILAAMITLPILALLPNGQKFIDLIPYVGHAEKGNIEYRELLFKNSVITIAKNPLFGSSNYLDTPEMQELVQGQGIIDIVNSYLRITLEIGYVGLSLFVGTFLSVIFAVRRQMKFVNGKKSELHILGASFVAILIAIMLILATTSSIGVITNVYWCVLGLAIAYTRIVKNQLTLTS